MPFDIVREVTDVDTTVLLRVLLTVAVHCAAFGLVAAGRSAITVTVCRGTLVAVVVAALTRRGARTAVVVLGLCK